MKKAYYIVAIIIGALATILLEAGAIIVFTDSHPDRSLALFMFLLGLIPLGMVVVSAIGLAEYLYVPGVITVKLGVFIAMAGVSALKIAIEESTDAENYLLIGFLVLSGCLLVAAGIYWNKKHVERKGMSLDQKRVKISAEVFYAFASDEYFIKQDGYNPGSAIIVPAETDEEIKKYAMYPICYYLFWLLRKNFVNDKFKAKVGAEQVEGCISGDILPSELIKKMNYRIKGQYLTKEAAEFTAYYLDNKDFCNADRKLIFDYYEAINNPEGDYYFVEYSKDTARKMFILIEKSYEAWKVRKNGNNWSQTSGYDMGLKETQFPDMDEFKKRLNLQNINSKEAIQKLVEEKEIEKVYLITKKLGGSEGEDNMIYLLSSNVPRKEKIDMKLEAIEAAFYGGVRRHNLADDFGCMKYSYKAEYNEDNSYMPVKLSAVGEGGFGKPKFSFDMIMAGLK